MQFSTTGTGRFADHVRETRRAEEPTPELGQFGRGGIPRIERERRKNLYYFNWADFFLIECIHVELHCAGRVLVSVVIWSLMDNRVVMGKFGSMLKFINDCCCNDLQS